jgi:hypothetical protein
MTTDKMQANYNPDDIVTIEQARTIIEAVTGTKCPECHMFHHAIGRGELTNLAGRVVKLRLGDVLDLYRETGLHGPHVKRGVKATSDTDAPASETDAGATPVSPCEVVGDDSNPPSTSTLMLMEPEASEVEPYVENVASEVPSEIAEVEAMLAGVADLTEAELITSIKDFAERAESLAVQTLNMAKRTMICGWATGVLLVKVKKACKHGKFGQWEQEHLPSLGLDTRTAQRYMQLANRCPDVRSLVDNYSGLMEAYIACNIIQERPAADDGEDPNAANQAPAGEGSSHAEALLSGLTSVQQHLRLFTSSSERLDAVQINQAKLVMKELNRFFSKLVATSDTNTQTAD